VIAARHLQGIDQSFDYKKVLKEFKKKFCCNGTVVDDVELGKVRVLDKEKVFSFKDFTWYTLE
jgi:translation initiation factor 1